MPPSEVSEEEWVCRFVLSGDWYDELHRPTPDAFRASRRELSLFHPRKVEQLGFTLRDLCIERLAGAGEAHLQVKTCIELGQEISDEFDPKVFWRPDKVDDRWKLWEDAHAQIESQGGNRNFPMRYRSLLAENATYLRPPEET